LQLQELGQPPQELFNDLIPGDLFESLSKSQSSGADVSAADLLNTPGELDERQFRTLMDSLLKQSSGSGDAAGGKPEDCSIM